MLLLLVSYRFWEWFIEFLYPLLYATKMEGCITLLAVPNIRSLINFVLANDALLLASSQRLHIKDALFGQVLKLWQEVLIVVLDLGLISCRLLLTLVEFYFILSLIRLLFFNVIGTGAQILSWPEFFVAFASPSAHNIVCMLHQVFMLSDFGLVEQAARLLVTLYLLLFAFFKVFSVLALSLMMLKISLLTIFGWASITIITTTSLWCQLSFFIRSSRLFCISLLFVYRSRLFTAASLSLRTLLFAGEFRLTIVAASSTSQRLAAIVLLTTSIPSWAVT